MKSRKTMTDSKKSQDEYVMYGPPCCDEHRAMPCVRSRNGKAEPGLLMPAGEDCDMPEGAEIVKLEHVGQGIARIAEVIKKPTMVNSQAFRNNYDSIFGCKQTVGEA